MASRDELSSDDALGNDPLACGLPATRPESLDRLHMDASCLLGIVTIGCDLGREFTAEREVKNSGDPLIIRLMMRADSKLLATFFRDQGVYLFIALVVGAIFWAIGQPINPYTVILYSLCIGNFLSPPCNGCTSCTKSRLPMTG